MNPAAGDRITILNTFIKAIIARHGTPDATNPPSTSLTVTQAQYTQATALQLTIRAVPPDVNPEPYFLLVVEGL